jgi:hypothetical protein
MATAVILLVLAAWGAPARAARRGPQAAMVTGKIPLPQPRPAEAPNGEEEKSTEEAAPATPDKPAQEQAAKPAQPDKPAAPPQSACRVALTEEIAIAPSIPPIRGPGACGGEDLVRLEAIVLPDKHKVTVNPPATLRCSMASAIADWVRTDVVSIAAGLGSEPAVLENFDSYECRGFNRIPGAHLSEHGRANALDVGGFKLVNGRAITLTDRTVPRELREQVLHSVCARFMTVLGPDSDWYHEEHIHLDLMERRNNYKICQWDVLDPLPNIAPLLPAVRPEEAPPREVAKDEDKGGDSGTHAKAAPADKAVGEPEPADGNGAAPDTDDTAAAPAAPPPAPAKNARKKRRKEK